MESGLRWILILISLIILGLIAFDGWRRINKQKAEKVKLLNETNDEALDNDQHDDDILLKENIFSADEREVEELPQYVAKKVEKIELIENADKTPATFFALNILPEPGQVFTGSHLLPTLLTLGLRYGEMSIFHRHEQISGNGNVLFSLASATEPGIFDLEKMESQHFYGLTLFFQVPGPAHPSNALNLMVQTAKRLAHILGGQLCDEKRQYLSESNLEQQYQIRLRQALGKI